MSTETRRNQLLELVQNKGFASIPELVEELQVSESTVRRDLDVLEENGVARRTHGGVLYSGSRPQFPHFQERNPAQWGAKRAIAQRAAELIEDSDTVLLDGGSTTYEVAQLLIGRPLQVVTNSLPVANLLASNALSDLVLLGGYVYPRTGVMLGPYTVSMLSEINVRRTVMSVAGATQRGFYNSNLLLVETEQAMIDSADEVIVVADSSKFGHQSLAHLCELGRVDRLVIDQQLSEPWRRRLRDAGVDVVIAEVDETPNTD
jgi:DeoR/GlpR family transcriptional regulator of sugar metabolism